MELKFRRNPDYQDLRAEMTPHEVYIRRRELLAAAGFAGTATLVGGGLPAFAETPATQIAAGATMPATKSAYTVTDPTAAEQDFNEWCNFYEFGLDKDDPARNAGRMDVSNWKIKVEGETDAPGTYDLAQLIDYSKLEERVYRHRCVERWSMVVPWIGVSLWSVVSQLKPKPEAKYVQFLTHIDRTAMVGLAYGGLNWPYSEALHLNEAKNELAFLAVGSYGKALKQQNGAPVRSVVPWKYGYKGAKSISTIRFTTSQPPTAWNAANPREYGFYSNVNPERPHPRWSQRRERVLGVGGFNVQRDTEMFNGYEKQVGYLYKGIDLIKYH
ncbi:MAG: protein-methionine-sulfoxide reductase catalytic subunit MsrP [Hyphomonadaceae bacterium]